MNNQQKLSKKKNKKTLLNNNYKKRVKNNKNSNKIDNDNEQEEEKEEDDVEEEEEEKNEMNINNLLNYKQDLIEQLSKELEIEKEEKEKLKLNSKKCYYEKIETLNMLKKCQNERDCLQIDLNNLKDIRLKESRRAKAEMEALSREYCQIMSERDTVHKEIDALQERLNKSEDKVKQLNHSNSAFFISSSNFVDVNNSLDLNATRTSFNTDLKISKSIQNDNNNLVNSSTLFSELQFDMLKNQLKQVTKQRDEAYSKIEELCSNSTIIEYKLKEMNLIDKRRIDLVNEDIDSHQMNQSTKEINKILKELDLSKKRRDMAFIERDKIIKERESIRALCDELRHQRDKAISELAEAIRESDDLKKYKSAANKQIDLLEDKLSYYEEKLIAYKEKEERNNNEKSSSSSDDDSDDVNENTNTEDNKNISDSIQFLNKDELDSFKRIKNSVKNSLFKLNSNSMQVNGSQEDNEDQVVENDEKCRILKIEINLDEDKNLGVEFACATFEDSENNYPNKQNKNLIIISNIDSNSIAFGKLKENDNVLRINEYDLKEIDLERLEDIIKNLSGTVNFIVSRHFKKGFSNEPSSNTDLENFNLSNMQSINSSLTSLSNEKKKHENNNIKKSDFKKTNENFKSNAVDYLSLLNSKHNKNIIIDLENFRDIQIETSVYILDINRNNINSLSIGDRIISINGISTKNKSLNEIKEIINEAETNRINNPNQKCKFKLLIQKADSQIDNYSNFTSSIFSLDFNNDIRFKNNDSKSQLSFKYPESSLLSSNSIESSSIVEHKFDSNKSNKKTKLANKIRPLYDYEQVNSNITKKENYQYSHKYGYYDQNNKNENDYEQRSRFFDEIVDGSIKYEDLITSFKHDIKSSNFNLNHQSNDEFDEQTNEQIKKIFL